MNKSAPVDFTTHSVKVVNFLWLGLPLLALVITAVWLTRSDWLNAFETGAPPVERLTFERTVLDGDGLHFKVRAGGSEPVEIAQVVVDDAFWNFRQEPPGSVDRLASAWLHIPYPWVLGEAHEVTILTRQGTTFTKEIAVAVATPQQQAGQLLPQAMLGAFVGIVPVVIGMLFYPVLRTFAAQRMNFVLALTVGLLGFLFVGILQEGLEFGHQAAVAFQGTAMVLVVAAITFLVLVVVARRHGSAEPQRTTACSSTACSGC